MESWLNFCYEILWKFDQWTCFPFQNSEYARTCSVNENEYCFMIINSINRPLALLYLVSQ